MECNEAIAVKSGNSQNYKLTGNAISRNLSYTDLQMCNITEVPYNSACDSKMVNTG